LTFPLTLTLSHPMGEGTVCVRFSFVRSGFLPAPLMADIEKLGAFLPLLGVREVIVTDS
jgi:hypothetical protein